MDVNGQTSNISNFKMPTPFELSQLGIKLTNIQMVNEIDELRKTPPNIVIAECVKNVFFKQNQYFRPQQLLKRGKYVMSLGVYHQLHFDTQRNIKILKPSGLKFDKIFKPYTGQDLSNKTLLIWRTGGLGDILFISPNIKHLKEIYPNCKIIFACGPQYQAMVKTWKFIDRVVDLPFSIRDLLDSDYHCIFEGVIERTKQAERENAYRLFTKWMGLNLPDDKLLPKQEVEIEALERCRNTLKEWNIDEKSYIVMQMRASSPIRTPRPVLFKKLINKLTEKGHNVILTDLPRMEQTISKFIDELDNKEKVFNFSKYSKEISDTIALTSLAKLSTGTDSALMHISISVGTPIFGLYGPFPGNIRLETYPENMRDWVDAKVDCSPCFIHSMYPCKNTTNGFPKCYDVLDIDEIVERIERLL